MAKLKWLRGRLALRDPDRYQEGLGYYAEALAYASRDGEDELQHMLSRVDAQARRLTSQGARGLGLVLYDYLQAFARDQGFSDSVLSHLTKQRERRSYAGPLYLDSASFSSITFWNSSKGRAPLIGVPLTKNAGVPLTPSCTPML